MIRILTSLAVFFAGSSAALAHVGDHSEGFVASLRHLLSQPDHVATIAIVAVAALALWRYANAKMS